MSERPVHIICGGIQDAPGRENDLKVTELARFAVSEYNNKTNGMLEFERVVKVRQQLVAGMVYYITVEVKEGDAKKMYEASVWEKTWMNFKELSSFQPVSIDDTETTDDDV
ncbi:hypothetical protein PR202_ga05540 [Eleusine coracana subsp. coracana]|uniref:Cysteine proteinase inhibitor n=1 Tax=Eleusine coracana subsp. coracana TaxID=191504 RepID=A0AAV5BTS0_ELECO|nr:hypothetical protein PR202_ga05087 [Eleusine coracana subsp. coracana]GJM89354.1 hypothetical protein PR202_ga05540 [Eleusine coracana subsp. coracana]